MAILTLTAYKKINNITNTDKDEVTTQTIKAVDSFVTSYCNREFTEYYATDKTEYFDGMNTNEIYPEVYPIVSINTIKTSTDGGQTYATTLAEFTDYVIDIKNSKILSTGDCFVTTNIATNSLELVYKAGYLRVPEDLKLAAAHLVEYYLEEQYTPKKAFSGVSVENIIMADTTARLPSHIRRVLDHYRTVNF